MGIRTLASNLKTHINMKFQITVLFALVAAAAAAKLPMGEYKQQAMAARDNAQNKMADAVAKAQQMANNAKQQMNNALKGIENKKLRNNLKNLLANLQSEGKKMAENM